jgi:hypothetical protein
VPESIAVLRGRRLSASIFFCQNETCDRSKIF